MKDHDDVYRSSWDKFIGYSAEELRQIKAMDEEDEMETTETATMNKFERSRRITELVKRLGPDVGMEEFRAAAAKEGLTPPPATSTFFRARDRAFQRDGKPAPETPAQKSPITPTAASLAAMRDANEARVATPAPVASALIAKPPMHVAPDLAALAQSLLAIPGSRSITIIHVTS